MGRNSSSSSVERTSLSAIASSAPGPSSRGPGLPNKACSNVGGAVQAAAAACRCFGVGRARGRRCGGLPKREGADGGPSRSQVPGGVGTAPAATALLPKADGAEPGGGGKWSDKRIGLDGTLSAGETNSHKDNVVGVLCLRVACRNELGLIANSVYKDNSGTVCTVGSSGVEPAVEGVAGMCRQDAGVAGKSSSHAPDNGNCVLATELREKSDQARIGFQSLGSEVRAGRCFTGVSGEQWMKVLRTCMLKDKSSWMPHNSFTRNTCDEGPSGTTFASGRLFSLPLIA